MRLPSPIVQLKNDVFTSKNVEVYLKRDDLIHPEISGNKWRKLKYNLAKFEQGGYAALLTFGGAYSNHIAATAALGAEKGIQTIGIIRGDELNQNSNETLKAAAANGMQLVFTKREEYALRAEKYYHEELRRRHGHLLIVPEGGANYYGVLGCQEIVKECQQDYDYIYAPAGTGTTIAGLLVGSQDSQVVGVAALKNGSFLAQEVELRLLEFGFDKVLIATYMQRLFIETEFHFGGYAKHTPALIAFMNDFYRQHQVPLDVVYTAKMMQAFVHHVETGKINEGSKVLALHTGGLQGNSAIQDQLLFD